MSSQSPPSPPASAPSNATPSSAALSASAAADGCCVEEQGVPELIFWVKCDACDRWRVVNGLTLKEQRALQSKPWFCRMHPNEAQRACDNVAPARGAELGAQSADFGSPHNFPHPRPLFQAATSLVCAEDIQQPSRPGGCDTTDRSPTQPHNTNTTVVAVPSTSSPAAAGACGGAAAPCTSARDTPAATDAGTRMKPEDAFEYLERVRATFAGLPHVYNSFLAVMREFKDQTITTEDVINRVKLLFKGYPYLVQGFNMFLPPAYRIKVEAALESPTNTAQHFASAHKFVTKVKERFRAAPHTYLEFLTVLHKYAAASRFTRATL
jgi:histone deacetylase complex regulatory component SIN3